MELTDLLHRADHAVDLDERVHAWTEVVAAAADPEYLNELGMALTSRYEQHGAEDDLRRALEAYVRAVAGADDPGYLHNLGQVFRYQGRLDEAISVLRDAAGRAEPEDLELCRSTLGASLLDRYRETGDLADLDATLALATDEVALAELRYERWWRCGDEADLRAVYALLPERIAARHLLGYRRDGRRDDAATAVAELRDVLAETGSGPGRADLLRDLAEALRLSHEATGDPDELTEAVETARSALTLAPERPGARASFLGQLANTLLDRFDRAGDLADLAEPIRLLSDAAGRLPPGAPGRPDLLNDLGNALRTRFTHTGAEKDREAAARAFSSALTDAEAGAPGRYAYLDNLANVRVDQRRLDEAIRVHADALSIAPEGAEQVRILGNLAAAHWHRWALTLEQSDQDAAISAFAEAVERTPDGQAGRTMRLNNLAVALVERDGPGDRRTALAAFREAAGSGARTDALWGLRAARSWGDWASVRGSMAEAAEAYHHGLRAMRRLVSEQRRRGFQEQWLRETRGVGGSGRGGGAGHRPAARRRAVPGGGPGRAAGRGAPAGLMPALRRL